MINKVGVMEKRINRLPQLEVIIGLVAPLGTQKELFMDLLKKNFNLKDIDVIDVSVTKELIQIPESLNISKSLDYYLKMEICSELRKTKANSILVNAIISSVRKKERKNHHQKLLFTSSIN